MKDREFNGMITINERIANYHKACPKYPPLYKVNKRLEGVWYIGKTLFRKAEYYGEYPGNYLTRVHSLFPDCKKILHLFSGKVKEKGAISFDINLELKPDVCGDVMQIDKIFSQDNFDLIIADPPYETEDFKRYGATPFDRREVLRKVHPILTNGGFLVWLDLMIPPFSNKLWDMVGLILIATGTNCRFRGVSILQKK